MALLFEWDPRKARINLMRHGISFDEARTVFKDAMSITVSDPLHSEDEERFILLGYSKTNKLLVVVHTERGDRIRIISSRLATKKERELYEEKKL